MSTGLPGDETGQPAVPQQPGYGGPAGQPPPPPPSAPLAGGAGQPEGGYAQPAPPPAASTGSTGSTGYGGATPTASTGGTSSTSKAATSFDAKSVSTPEWLVIGGAVAYFIALLLPWWSFGSDSLSISVSGFDGGGLLIFAWLLLLAAAVLILLPAFGVKLAMPVPAGLLALGLTGLALLFTVIRFFNLLSEAAFGRYLGLLAALAAVAGAVMLFQAERRTGSTT